MEITKEMIDHFAIRTNKHISLVQTFYMQSYQSLKWFTNDEHVALWTRIQTHDINKFQHPLMYYYILITWKYKCLRDNIPFEVSDELNQGMIDATNLHIKNAPHHPEFWDPSFKSVNVNDRDKPSGISVDATNMIDTCLVEMVCDWCAVSFERGGNPKDWFNMNLNTRWHFNEEQIQLINNWIDIFWRPENILEDDNAKF